jgi:hypothetical protein
MHDLLLYASGTLGLALAFVHGLLGETRVLARALIEPERLRLLIRGVWHCSAVAWAGVAVLLIVAPWMGSQMARHWIVGAAVVIYGFGAIANAWAMRGRHFGWGRVGRAVSPLREADRTRAGNIQVTSFASVWPIPSARWG